MLLKQGSLVCVALCAVFGLARQEVAPTVVKPKQVDKAKPIDPTQVPTVVGQAPDTDTQVTSNQIEGITFAEAPGEVYIPLTDFADLVGWDLNYDAATKTTTLHDQALPAAKLKVLFSGKTVMALSELSELGTTVAPVDDNTYGIKVGDNAYSVVVPDKFVEVSISRQTLRAWQGHTLVMKTHISSGRPGHATPMGKYKTGPAKTEMHHSTLYENAPMPWAVEINGDIFIHGSGDVPGYPASHGCVRMPMGGKNAAHYFYKWVDLGVRVNVLADWDDEAKDLIAMEDEGDTELATPGKIKPPTGVGKPPSRRPAAAVTHAPRKPVVIPKVNPNQFIGPAPGGH